MMNLYMMISLMLWAVPGNAHAEIHYESAIKPYIVQCVSSRLVRKPGDISGRKYKVIKKHSFEISDTSTTVTSTFAKDGILVSKDHFALKRTAEGRYSATFADSDSATGETCLLMIAPPGHKGTNLYFGTCSDVSLMENCKR